jgi:thiosulfate dehydrogenase
VRNVKKIAVVISALLIVALIIFACAKEQEATEVDPAAELAASVESGKALFYDESLGTSGMTCNSCHMEGGTMAGKMGDMAIPAWDHLGAKYPKYFAMAKRVMTLSQVVNWCIDHPLEGQAFTWDDQKLTDLTAYVASVKPASVEE